MKSIQNKAPKYGAAVEWTVSIEARGCDAMKDVEEMEN